MKSRSVTSKPDAELDKWCAALTAEIFTDEVPEGWLTAAQLSQRLNKPTSTMNKLLVAAVRSGKAEVKKFRVSVGAFVRPTQHYRLK